MHAERHGEGQVLGLRFEETTSAVIGAAIRVHRALGPGLLESVYRKCLVFELQGAGVRVECERPLAVDYGPVHVPNAYRLDLLVEQRVVVELKSVEEISRLHVSQLLTYLRLGGFRVGLLINFNVPVLVKGITRVVL